MVAIFMHEQEPEKWTPEVIASQLKLSEKDVRNILKYNGMLTDTVSVDKEVFSTPELRKDLS